MKNFDQLLQDDIANYEGRHDDLIYQAPAFYRLMTCLLDDPALPASLRPLVLAAIAYFILPVDVISEALEGPYGYVDDIWLCAWVAEKVRKETGKDEILVANWDGETGIIPLVKEILANESNFLEDKGRLVLKYIGWVDKD